LTQKPTEKGRVSVATYAFWVGITMPWTQSEVFLPPGWGVLDKKVRRNKLADAFRSSIDVIDGHASVLLMCRLCSLSSACEAVMDVHERPPGGEMLLQKERMRLALAHGDGAIAADRTET
jgi:hypothetical protein